MIECPGFSNPGCARDRWRAFNFPCGLRRMLTLGSPIQDNLVTKAFHGTLGYSLGPGMMLHAPILHPAVHLLGKL